MKLNENKPALSEGLITDYEKFLGDIKTAYVLMLLRPARSGDDSRWLGAVAKTFEAELVEKEFVTDIDAIHSRRIREVITNHVRGIGGFSAYLKRSILGQEEGSGVEAKIILAGLVAHLESAIYAIDQEDRNNQQVFDLRRSLRDELDTVVDLRVEKNELQALADKDPLTGLDRIHVLERKLKSESSKGHLFFLDFNGLGVVNKVLGDRVGDMSILHAGNVLAKVLRDEDFISRKGGDEFVGLYEGENVDPEAASIRIIEGFRKIPMVIDLRELNIPIETAQSYVDEWNKRTIGYCKSTVNTSLQTMMIYLGVAIGVREFDSSQSFEDQVGYTDQLMSAAKFKAKDRDETGTKNPKDSRLKAARDTYLVEGSVPVVFED